MFLRQSISLAAMAAMLTTSMSTPVGATSPTVRRPDQQSYCRTPAPLPQLGAESAPRTQNHRGGHLRRGDVDGPVPLGVPAPAPPPPPAAPGGEVYADFAPAEPLEAGEVVVTASAAPAGGGDSGRRAAPSSATTTDLEGRIIAPPSPVPPRPLPHPRPQPRAQAGLLTAGEHDDLLNPLLYARYVQQSNLGQRIPDLPRVDTGRVLTVRTIDTAGRPVAFADVTVTCSDGNSITLRSQADGRATFFPDLDRLSRTLRVSTTAGMAVHGRTPQADVILNDGAQSIDLRVNTRLGPPVQKVDLALVIDTTGSMGDEITYLQTELANIVASLQRRHPNVEILVGFVFYRDIGDDYVTRTVDFSGRVSATENTLAQERAYGGGDYPEAMDQALIRASGLRWRDDAIKTLLLVADAPPHDAQMGDTWTAAEHLRAQGVHITPVAASGVADEAEYAMRAMAAFTQSRYLFLTDDSGIGNPHAAPAIDCYYVTRLDSLLRRVIDSQISGRRIEPNADEIIRSVGQQDNGRCILPPRWDQQ